jgi:hypothetical protein
LLFFGFGERLSRKNSASNRLDSCSRTLPVWRTWWFNLGSSRSRYRLRQAPAFGSLAPYTSRSIRLRTIAPAHIRQGSSVT